MPMSDVSVKFAPAQPLTSRSQALLQVTEAIAHHRDLAELFHDLAARLHDVAHFDYLNLVLHDPERQVMRLHLLEALREKPTQLRVGRESDRKSTRLNSSHVEISYAVFCLKKKTTSPSRCTTPSAQCPSSSSFRRSPT